MRCVLTDPICENSGSLLVAIPAIAAHLPIVEISLSRLRERFKNASFLIVSPSPHLFNHLADKQTRIAPDSEFAAVSKIEVEGLLSPNKRQRSGWYYQQLLKYAIVSAAPFVRVLILDADTVVLREIEIAHNEFFTSKERHKPYFQHFLTLFNADPPFKSSAITNFMWFRPVALRRMLSEIEKIHKKSWLRAIIDIVNLIEHDGAFSEYETYANWFALRNGPHKELPIHIFRRGDLLLSKKRNYRRVVDQVLRSNFDSVAFELNHRQDIIRKIGSQIILRLSIKDW
jgi:hypothetical protein